MPWARGGPVDSIRRGMWARIRNPQKGQDCPSTKQKPGPKGDAGGINLVNALLLDLDGTLLDIDFRNFMGEYLAGTASRFADHMPEETFQQQLLASTGAMLFNDDPNKTVLEAFLHDFGKNAPLPPDA